MELSLFLIILCIYSTSVVSIMPELKHNVLRFGYRVNFICEGMLSHLFDRLCGNEDRYTQGTGSEFDNVSV